MNWSLNWLLILATKTLVTNISYQNFGYQKISF